MLTYATLQPDGRSEAARLVLAQGGTISVQVVNASANVAYGKFRRPWLEIARALASLRALCQPPLPFTVATHEEDMQDGRVIEGRLTIRNPFRQV